MQSQSEDELQGATNYGDPEYWEVRYRNSEGERFDWLEDFNSLKGLLEEVTGGNRQTKILNIGCGNGQIQDRMYEAGWKRIVNNDISKVVIEQMSETNKYPDMLYQVMDVTAMSYPDESFDMVLDKSTIDALLCSDSPMLLVAKMIWEVYRVLKKGGTYFVVSYGAPKSRMEHLERQHVGFDIDVREIERAESPSGPHYIYICRKHEKSKCDEVKYKQLLKRLEEEDQQMSKLAAQLNSEEATSQSH